MKKIIEVKIVSSEHGFNDFEVINLANVHRACVGHGIKNGDIFNIYCFDNLKLGGVWCEDAVKSLANFAETEAYLEFTLRNESTCRGCGDVKTGHGMIVCGSCFKGEYTLFTPYKYFKGSFAEWLANVEVSRKTEAAQHGG